MPDDKAKLQSDKGKEILAYATGKDYCIIEFATLDTGEMTVADITAHVRALEDEVAEDG